MKKLLVGLLSIFMVLGGVVLSACGGDSVQLTIYDNLGEEISRTLEIEIGSADPDGGYLLLSARASNGEKNITASSTSSAVSVTIDSSSDDRVFFKVVGSEETVGEPAVISFNAGSAKEFVYINVYSQVKSMSAVKDNDENFFFVAGQRYLLMGDGFESDVNRLTEDSMIEFLPSKNSRRILSWEVKGVDSGEYEGVEGALEISNDVVKDGFVELRATDVHEKGNGATVEIKVPVIDAIEETISLAWNDGAGTPDESALNAGSGIGEPVVLISNVSEDVNYLGYAWVGYTGNDLVITPVVEKKSIVGKNVVWTVLEKLDNELLINYKGTADGYTYYEIKTASADNSSEYRISFKVGYDKYNYAGTTRYLYLDMQQKVDTVYVSTKGAIEAFGQYGSEIHLYDNYSSVQAVSNQEYGQVFAIDLSPEVEGGSGKYSIELQCPVVDGGITEDGSCPIDVFFKAFNGTVVPLNLVDGGDKWTQENIDANGELYIKVSAELKQQTISGFKLNFVSKDNIYAKTELSLTLHKSASQTNFDDIVGKTDANVVIDSSDIGETYTKTFTLTGQTTTNGLRVEYQYDSLSYELIPVSSDEEANTVTFDVVFALNDDYYGTTASEKYRIVHENGNATSEFGINIVLPFSEISVYPDMGNELSNSVVNVIKNGDDAVSLMLKNNSVTPLTFSMPKTNGHSPVITNFEVLYFDQSSSGLSLEDFLALSDGDVLANAIAFSSSVIYAEYQSPFTSASISTKEVGYTYMVLVFIGKNAYGEENIIPKIILIESFNSPEGLRIASLSNKTVEIFAADSVSDKDRISTVKDIEIIFENQNTTYASLENVTISSKIYGEDSKKYYAIDNLIIGKTGIQFTINGLSTQGYAQVSDVVNVVYSIKKDGKAVYSMLCTIPLTIKSADRIHSLAWLNSDENGLYFEANATGTDKTQYLIFETSPTNARNNDIRVVITDEGGNNAERENFVLRDKLVVSNNTVALNLGAAVTAGKSGYAYFLPEDAVFNNNLKYYYYVIEGKKVDYKNIDSYSLEELTLVNADCNIDKIASIYDDLIKYSFFTTDVVKESQGECVLEKVSFADILVKVKIEVADGSKEHPLRVYNKSQFTQINPVQHYLIMNDIDVSDIYFWDFSGGMSGVSKDVTLTLNRTLITTLAQNAYIKNLTLIGNVEGPGFVCVINNGEIDGVIIDTLGNKPSTLTPFGGSVGGIAGVNQGTISNSKVLGLTIKVNGEDVGGIAGYNTGTITNCAVEFYNLATNTPEVYNVNTFSGTNVGALVGYHMSGTIDSSYAYDYTLSASETNNTNRVLLGTTVVDPFVAIIGSDAKLSKVFSVVGIKDTYAEGNIENYYTSYYNDATYESDVNIADDYKMKTTDEKFDAEINGGQAYFKDFYQEKMLSQLTADNTVQTIKENGYYKSIKVNEENGILFLYKIDGSAEDLSSSELQDLEELNSISIAKLLKIESSGKIIVTSSDTKIIKVQGSSIQVLQTGVVEITISVKQDASINRAITINVINAISDLNLTRSSDDGRGVNVEGKEVNVQFAKSVYIIATPNKSSLILGNLAKRYDFIKGEYQLVANSRCADVQPGEIAVGVETSNNVISITTKKTATEKSGKSILKVYPQVFDINADEPEIKEKNIVLQQAIESTFAKQFVVNPSDGAISFNISAEQKPLYPSSTAVVKIQLKTTAKNDIVYPEIVMNDASYVMTRQWVEESAEYVFFDVFGNKVLTTTRSLAETPVEEANGTFTYVYNMTFAVHPDYQQKVADNINFKITFKTASGATSDSLDILLARQNITNVDTAKYKVTETYISGGSEFYEAKNHATTLSPGNSAIIKVNVNPEFAYYDYATIFYSGASVPNAVHIEAVEEESLGVYKTLTKDTALVKQENGKLQYIPAENSTVKHRIFFKVWINTTVDRDTTLKFTIAFYRNGQEKELDFVNTYIDVKYLTEPRVTISGEEVAYIAKGTTNEIKIEVLEDQTLDGLSLSGEKIEGVYITGLQGPKLDSAKGINVYTAKVVCNVDAKTDARNRFFIMATVAREIDGVRESKTTYATAVIVDFKLDEINIEGADDGTLTIWQNVPKEFDVNYTLIPDDSEYKITSENQDTIAKLKSAKKTFASSHYYPASAPTATSAEYYINWVEDEEGWKSLDLLDRLFVRTAAGDKPYNDESLDLPFEFYKDEDGLYKVKGIKSNAGIVTMVLRTYIIAGGIEKLVETEFNVNIETFSDPDLPLSIKSAEDFLALNPTNMTAGEIKPQDYILENDIVLENYTPFNTSAIRSLDGNGYTIYIKSFDVDSQKILNLALFNTVATLTQTEDNTATETTLKNIRVNYYNGGQLTIDISRHSEVNLAGIAITNDGVITNCEVVSFYQPALAGESLSAGVNAACNQHNKVKGFNVSYTNGANSDEVFISDNTKDWTSQIAGFVITNNGSITNSRVGGKEIYVITKAEANKQNASADEVIVDQFNIIGQGNIAGFVLDNNGTIASSFVKRVEIKNRSQATKFNTSGFVDTNSEQATIITSYVEGEESKEEGTKYRYANLGSQIMSDTGCIAGFIYENKGVIKNSYSNILISNSTDTNKVYLASGFVYKNEGRLENCYSSSQVENANYSQMNFSGVDKDGNLLTSGDYENCYYFNLESYSVEVEQTLADDPTESQFNTGATLVKNPTYNSSFYGFSIAENPTSFHKDGIWVIDQDYGIKLIEADYIAYSHRYKQFITGGDSGYYLTQEIDGETVRYILPYGILYIDSENSINTTLGGNYNPIIISDAQDWQDINGDSKSSYIKEYYKNGNVSGVYRIVKDIDLSVLNKDVNSTDKTLTGALYGNGFTINGIALSQLSSTSKTSFGLYSAISTTNTTGKKSTPAFVSNINMEVEQVTAGNVSAVGALAGIIQNATIVNVKVVFNEKSIVEGLNYTGGLVGFAYGDNKIKNIVITNPNILSDTYTEDEKNYITNENLRDFRNSVRNDIVSALSDTYKNYSYAGSAIGFIDNYDIHSQSMPIFTNSNDDTTIFDVNNLRVEGDVNVKAQVVGGVFGFVGVNTDVNDIGLTISAGENENSQLISTRYFAGGIAGQSFGRIARAFASHDKQTQDEIEDNLAKFYDGDTNVERGILDLFDTSKIDIDNTQVAVGGIIGYVGGGYLEISYSRLNVTSMSSQYAGGIIGYIDVAKALTYTVMVDTMYFENKDEAEGLGTKYFINEVYATGDVRAKEMAGGLIGLIKGETSDIKLLSVNALNYLTTYDYSSGKYDSLNEAQYDISTNLRVNSFVGAFVNSKGDIEEFSERKVSEIVGNGESGKIFKDKNGDAYEDDDECGRIKFESAHSLNGYISFVTGQEEASAGTSNLNPLPSVARYNYYTFAGHKVYLKRFGEPMLTITNEAGKLEYNKEAEDLVNFNESTAKMGGYMLNIYSIVSPEQYTDSTVGHTMTKSGFLDSGIWAFANWQHQIEDLFPEIKLKEVYDVVYLDVYNANEVFERMNSNPNLIVIVRGLKTKGANEDDPKSYDHIEIYQDQSNTSMFRAKGSDGGAFSKIGSVHSFAGKIVGGIYPVGAENVDDFTKIISYAGNFIESVDEGFSVLNQTFTYGKLQSLESKGATPADSTPNTLTIDNGLFVDKPVKGIKIVDSTIELLTNITATGNAGTELNFGLVAPIISSSVISGVRVKANTGTITKTDGLRIEAEVSTSIALLAITAENETAGKTLNAGLITGKLIQESEEDIMSVKGGEILIKENQLLISTQNSEYYTYANVGGYYGLVTITNDETIDPANFILGLASGFNKLAKLNIKHQTKLYNQTSHLYIGGFVGSVDNISAITQSEGALKYKLEYTLPDNVNDLRLGNIVGNLTAKTSIEVNSMNKAYRKAEGEISQNIISKTATNWGYIGGAVGYRSGAALTVQGFESIEMKANDLNLVSGIAGAKKADGDGKQEICYGGLVGFTKDQLSLNNNNDTTETEVSGDAKITQTNASKDNQISVGSLVGAITAVMPEDSTALKIEGKYTSTLNFNLTGLNVSAGGIVGKLYNSDTAGNPQNTTITSGKEDTLIRYDGDIIYSSDNKTDTKNLTGAMANLGGIVGVICATDNSATISSLTIDSVSHGGKFEVSSVQGATLNIGGSIGSVNLTNKSNKVSLKNAYNYGNTYVKYLQSDYKESSFIGVDEYNYGGLIGNVSAVRYTIEDNYVAESSHNSRYIQSTDTDTDTAHALFGKGTPTTNGEVIDAGLTNIISKTANLYSHAVCLMTDDNGTDIAYNTAYTDTRLGYNDCATGETIISKILSGLNKKSEDFTEGHKLRPIVLTGTNYKGSELHSLSEFKGLTYFTLIENISVENTHFKLKNTAFIGDGFKITYSNTAADNQALFDCGSKNADLESNDLSFVSSLIEDINVTLENANKGDYAGLAIRLKQNQQIYAVNAYGKMEIHSTNSVHMAGLVSMYLGKISDCSTDIDMIERADNSNTFVWGFGYGWQAETAGGDCIGNGAVVENCFSLGSVTTYSGSPIYPFTMNGDSKVSYNNCYSATRTFWNDYLTLESAPTTLDFYTKIHYDVDAVDYKLSNTISNQFTFTYTTLATTEYFKNSPVWSEINIDFNYGYPTLKYQYLKMSSYSSQGPVKKDCTEVAGHVCENQLYDCYIDTYEYTRCDNGVVPADKTTAYYRLPNAGVMAGRVADEDIISNFVLTNEIDLRLTSSYESNGQLGSLNEQDFDKNFDGQGHTIKGLQTSLFKKVSGGYIKNLRLTEVSGSSPALADSIEEATISNMTIGGNISARGGLANSATRANIYAVQSTMIITTSLSNISSVGMIAMVTACQVGYCSNYGNITVTSEFTSFVGGIVGSVNDASSKIFYSSNSGCIINQPNASDKKLSLCAGGIVGCVVNATIEVTGCCNSGIVKCGSKAMNADYSSINYAGGIAAYGNISFTNCYNEGSVEALAANGTYGYAIYGTAKMILTGIEIPCSYTEYLNSSNFTKFTAKYVRISQTSDQNVVAYGIGPGAGSSNICVYDTNADGLSTIFANGSALTKNEKIMDIPYTVETWTPDYEYNKLYYETIFYYGVGTNTGDRRWLGVQIRYYRISSEIQILTGTGIDNDTKTYIGSNLSPTYQATSNICGLPLSILYSADYRLATMGYTDEDDYDFADLNPNRLLAFYQFGSPSGTSVDVYLGASATITENFAMPVNSVASNYKRNIVKDYIEKGMQASEESITRKLKNDLAKTSPEVMAIKEKIKSIKDGTTHTSNSEGDVKKIGNKKFVFADFNVDNFRQGLITKQLTYKFEDVNRDNASYKVDPTAGGKKLSYSDLEIDTSNPDGKTVVITLNAYYDKALVGATINFNVSATYETSGAINTSSLNLYFVNGGIGLGLTNLDTRYKHGWASTRISTGDEAYIATSGNQVIFLVYDETLNDLIYKPKVQLSESTVVKLSSGDKAFAAGAEVNNLSVSELFADWQIAYFTYTEQLMKFTNGGEGSATIDTSTFITSQNNYIMKYIKDDGYMLPTGTGTINLFKDNGNGTYSWINQSKFDETDEITKWVSDKWPTSPNLYTIDGYTITNYSASVDKIVYSNRIISDYQDWLYDLTDYGYIFNSDEVKLRVENEYREEWGLGDWKVTCDLVLYDMVTGEKLENVSIKSINLTGEYTYDLSNNKLTFGLNEDWTDRDITGISYVIESTDYQNEVGSISAEGHIIWNDDKYSFDTLNYCYYIKDNTNNFIYIHNNVREVQNLYTKSDRDSICYIEKIEPTPTQPAETGTLNTTIEIAGCGKYDISIDYSMTFTDSSLTFNADGALAKRFDYYGYSDDEKKFTQASWTTNYTYKITKYTMTKSRSEGYDDGFDMIGAYLLTFKGHSFEGGAYYEPTNRREQNNIYLHNEFNKTTNIEVKLEVDQTHKFESDDLDKEYIIRFVGQESYLTANSFVLKLSEEAVFTENEYYFLSVSARKGSNDIIDETVGETVLIFDYSGNFKKEYTITADDVGKTVQEVSKNAGCELSSGGFIVKKEEFKSYSTADDSFEFDKGEDFYYYTYTEENGFEKQGPYAVPFPYILEFNDTETNTYIDEYGQEQIETIIVKRNAISIYDNSLKVQQATLKETTEVVDFSGYATEYQAEGEITLASGQTILLFKEDKTFLKEYTNTEESEKTYRLSEIIGDDSITKVYVVEKSEEIEYKIFNESGILLKNITFSSDYGKLNPTVAEILDAEMLPEQKAYIIPANKATIIQEANNNNVYFKIANKSVEETVPKFPNPTISFMNYDVNNSLDKMGLKADIDTLRSGKFTVYVKSSKNATQEDYVLTGHQNSISGTADPDTLESGPSERIDIVLTKDISIGQIDYNLPLIVNLIGNGYNLSYYERALYNSLGNTATIKDVNILSSVEITSGEAYIFKDGGSGTINNLNLYGNIVNIESKNRVLIGGRSDDSTCITNISGFTSYISLNAQLTSSETIIYDAGYDDKIDDNHDLGNYFYPIHENKHYVLDNNISRYAQYDSDAWTAKGDDNVSSLVFGYDYITSDGVVYNSGEEGFNTAYAERAKMKKYLFENYYFQGSDFSLKNDNDNFKYNTNNYILSRLPLNYCYQGIVDAKGYTEIPGNSSTGLTYVGGAPLFYKITWHNSEKIDMAYSYYTDYSKHGPLNGTFTYYDKDKYQDSDKFDIDFSDKIFKVDESGKDNGKYIVKSGAAGQSIANYSTTIASDFVTVTNPADSTQMPTLTSIRMYGIITENTDDSGQKSRGYSVDYGVYSQPKDLSFIASSV